MLASGGGVVVNMSSIYGLAGRAAHHAYVASRHAVVGMSRSVALEHATRGIRVNALCAGVTATLGMRQAEALVPDVVYGLVAQHPMARMERGGGGQRRAVALLTGSRVRHGRGARGGRWFPRGVSRAIAERASVIDR
jgi:NAD(P)-dependent dehydrogenase (short-subunit alcohol dehydrogenase family)